MKLIKVGGYLMVPGVVVAVPLPQRRVPAVGRVMAAQSVPGVVGHGVQVIHGALCRERQTGVSHRARRALSSGGSLLSLPRPTLTAALRGELPQVELFEGEVDESGEFAGSVVGVGETLQV